jgi:hypothetical protein
LRNLYEDTIYTYSGLIQCIETIGNGKKFYYNSLRSFGTPTEQDVENAKFILHFHDDKSSECEIPKYNSTQAEEIFRAYSKNYDFTYDIKHSSTMGAIAMVLNNIKSLVVNSNHTFSDVEMNILKHHEIGVHMVTTMNGLLQPLKIFSNGFPNCEETQEGLAVFSEYMSGKGYSFSKTFRLLHNTYDLNGEDAFYITVRAHRGGGFTKDYLYLSGLKKVYNYYKEGKDLGILLTGKVSLDYSDDIQFLLDRQYASKPKHLTTSLQENINTNNRVDFILNNLK